MSKTTRFGISIDSELLKKFDKRNKLKGYLNRSEAIRDLIRDCLVTEQWEKNEGEMVGVVSLVFDHHRLDLPNKLTEEQHKYHSIIISSLHIHLDKHNCLEVLLLRGEGEKIRKLAENLISHKGVKHGRLSLTTTGEDIS